MDIVFVGKIEKSLRRIGVKTAIVLFVLLGSFSILSHRSLRPVVAPAEALKNDEYTITERQNFTPAETVTALYRQIGMKFLFSPETSYVASKPYLTDALYAVTSKSEYVGFMKLFWCIDSEPNAITVDSTKYYDQTHATVHITVYHGNRSIRNLARLIREQDIWLLDSVECPA